MKPLGPSLGVNHMWTKRNDHAPKSEFVFYFYFYFNICPKRTVLKQIKFFYSFVFIFSSPKKTIKKSLHK